MNEIIYYCEYVDSNGLKHYAVHKFNKISKFVTSLRDLML